MLPVLCAFANSAGAVQISYRGIIRYARIGSFSTVSKVLQRFQRISLLQVVRATDDGLRACNTYVLTFDSPLFQGLLRETHEREQRDIQTERQIRTEERNARRASRRADYKGKSSLQLV